jgi:DNA-binding MarR family transcriptional regulator
MSNNTTTFAHLNYARDYERKNFPFIESLVDRDVLLAIVTAQVSEQMISLSDIMKMKLGSVATVERRISRLKEMGIITSSESKADRRTKYLRVNTKVKNLFIKYNDGLMALAA